MKTAYKMVIGTVMGTLGFLYGFAGLAQFEWSQMLIGFILLAAGGIINWRALKKYMEGAE